MSSLWLEDETNAGRPQQASVSDVHFKIDCNRLPIDHAYLLSKAILSVAPWLEKQPTAAVHAIHVAASQNGWERPDMDSENDLLLSKRTRLKIRIDNEHTDRLIDSLRNQTLDIAGNPLVILSGLRRALTATPTLFSRYTCFDQLRSSDNDEKQFVDAVIKHCNQYGYQPTKLLCGRGHSIATEQGAIFCRSVMLADIPDEHSLRLQEIGIGDQRRMGCGILLPHKDTGAVHQTNSSGS